ncbi:MAG: AraC family transcriptional regulator [Acidobacteriota bacterium]
MSNTTASPKPLEIGHFFGSNVRSKEHAGFRLSETVYPAGMRVPVHCHELPYFCLLLGGGYWERYGRRHVEFEPGSIVFHPEKQVHHGDIRPQPTRCFHLEVDRSWIARVDEHGGFPSEPVEQASGQLAWLAARLFEEFRRDDSASRLTIEAIGLELLGRLVRQNVPDEKTAPRWLQQVIDRLHEEYMKPLTVAQMADDIGVSAVRLGRSFRRWKGLSLGAYQRRLRVEHVSNGLSDPEVGLAQLAVDAGFSDQSHMTRMFKRATGMTPARYRQLIQS